MPLDGRKEMTNKLSINSFDDDFGFTFADEEEIQQAAVQEHVETNTILTTNNAELASNNEELTNRIQQMYDAVIPLLKNLSKNPNQEFIKWPNRTAKIEQFKAKLDKIGENYIKVKSL